MLTLFLAELKRQWIQLRRYATEAIAGIIGITIAFYALFLTTQYVAGPAMQFGDRLDAIVVGYVLWSLVTFIIGDIAGGLQQEAFTGTLEQLFLSPFGAPWIFLTRALANLVIQLGQNVAILLIITSLTGSTLAFPPVLVLPLVTVLLGAYGLALAIGSLALLLKRVQQLLGFLPFGLFLLLTVPTESSAPLVKWLSWLLPMTAGSGLMRDLMARGQGLDWGVWAIALANGAFYFALGIWLFLQAERFAKSKGKLGGY
jgi:ABC-2 type transport system permease protein